MCFRDLVFETRRGPHKAPPIVLAAASQCLSAATSTNNCTYDPNRGVPVKVALLHYAAPPVIGGVEKVLREHSRLLARAGHTVRIIAGRGAQVDPEAEFVRLPLIDSLAAEILALRTALDAGIVPAEFEALSNQIEFQLREQLVGFEWLMVHNVCSLPKNLAATSALHKLAEAHAVRLALWHHDLAWTTPRYRSQLHEGFPWDLLRSNWPNAVQVTVSESRRVELAQLLEIPISEIHVVPNGIDPYAFLGIDEEVSGLAATLGLLDADPLLLLPARVTPRKNIEKALHVLSALGQRLPDALLLVTGPVGAHNLDNRRYLGLLAQLSRDLGIEDRVVFLTLRTSAVVSDKSMAQLYRLADALLFPSREEGFGIPILEAGLAGIPIFCSEIPTLVELGRDDATYFSPDADPTTVADMIASTIRADRPYALRKRVFREFGWDHIYPMHIAPILQAPYA